MIDLSNNNGGRVDFAKVFAGGTRRIYLKATEGTNFVDATYLQRRHAANAEKLLTGAYHFAHGKVSPKEEADFFLKHIGVLHPAKDLRPVLDLEMGTASAAFGKWAVEWLAEVKKHVGIVPLVYSYASFAESCKFTKPPAPLWLAAYGPNDGKEHPYSTPRPWRSVVAHQYTSKATVKGVTGYVDQSRVFNFGAFSLPAGV